MAVYLNSIETSNPKYCGPQQQILDFITHYQEDRRYKLLFKQAIKKSGIDFRHSVINDTNLASNNTELFHRNPDGTIHNPTTSERNAVYEKHSGNLAFDAIEKISTKTDIQDITHIITVSCTGFYSPGLDVKIIKHFNLNKNIERINIGFVGCQAAFPALKTAKEFCEADAQAKVLVVCVEMCTLHMKLNQDPNYIIGNSIFSDGCAACIVSSKPYSLDEPCLELKQFRSHIIDDQGKNLSWKIGDHGFDLTLNADLPRFIAENITESLGYVPDIQSDIDYWCVHPGGRAILDAFAKFKPDADLQYSRKVLQEYGNMSSPTVLFVLKEITKQKHNNNKNIFGATFGPGITIESAIFNIL